MVFLRKSIRPFVWSIAFLTLFSFHSFAQTEKNNFPWKSGEKLTYEISWGFVTAADAIFTATEKPGRWIFHLELNSRGIVNAVYPINCWFWSCVEEKPWRSLEFGQFRNEPHRWIRERTRIDYSEKKGIREKWSAGKTEEFSAQAPVLNDIGSMLYLFRFGPWSPGERRPLLIYEDGQVKQGEAICVKIENRAIGMWPQQSLLEIYAEPLGSEKKKGNLTVWITNDAHRLPIRASLVFRYGTFTVNLVKMEKQPPLLRR